MTKEKIKYILKILPYAIKLIKEGKTEATFYENNHSKTIVVDNEVRAVLEIVDELIANEKPDSWVMKILLGYKKGKRDIAIIMNAPVSRATYYSVKASLVNKIYDCCVYKGLVPYKNIINEEV